MSWDDIQGQQLVKRIWQAHLAAGTVSSAYLLTGPAGIGKRLLAREMAKALNCTAAQDRPCDRCLTCVHIMKQLHPDVHWLVPEGASGLIKIEAVRRVLGRIALRPYSARYQVVIIDGADRLTEEAANSLLKSLEEPPAHTRFLLVTSQAARCLSTITSRCQLLRCRRLATAAVQDIVLAAGACDAAAAPVIARVAGGSAARALELAGRWTDCQHRLDQLAAESLSAWLEAPPPEARDDVQRLVDEMVAWLRDVAVVQIGRADAVVHQAAAPALRRAAGRLDRDRCLETAFELVSLRESLDQFVSPKLVASLAREQWLSLTHS